MIEKQGLEPALRRVAEMVRTPEKVDSVTTLRRIEAEGATLRFVFDVTVDAAQIPESMRAAMTSNACNRPALRPALASGATIEWVYVGRGSGAIGTIKVTELDCAGRTPRQEPTKDEVLREKIVGSWSEGISPYTIATFSQGGGYKGVAYSTSEKRDMLLSGEGTWWIKDGVLYSKVNKMNPPTFPLDKVYVDKIVDISDETMTLIDMSGQKYTKTKIP
ncbi:hypothetical protein HQ394_06120 [Defluviicoccus vanus]|uniref:Uncharacterized protein n=2 Tax=Defluviicoccus vanus TaxID=111831 RepID=A0A7H1MZW8_9PROT|nr:hypothetical protein HQ394_06120 [Defluviicoccus vanus]